MTDVVKAGEDLVTLTIDDIPISVPKGTLIIRAAELIGVQIPRFCDHPLLEPVGACRQCLVEIPDAGNGRGMPKPQASCTIEVAEGMVVKTQLTSGVAAKAQEGVMEFLLANHPLDCPVCDKGGECPLQNQAMSNGRGESRFFETGSVKRNFEKPINISSQVLLDRERCVLCARCTRFSDQIAGDPLIDLMERGALQQVGIYEDQPFESYFSGNTIQICPVGALTSAQYRFRSRPFDLKSTPSGCEHCASGCSLRTDHRRGKVMRRLAGDDPEVNEEWSCDKGRFAFRYAQSKDRLTQPMVRNAETGELELASWSEAFRAAGEGLARAAEAGGVGVLPGGRLTVEDAYAYSKFARTVLRTNDVDFRSRAYGNDEEAAFLGSAVAGTGLTVTYRDLDNAEAVLLVGFEPEEESPIVFLRLRKAAMAGTTTVYSVAPYTTKGLTKMQGRLLRAAPGTEAEVLDALGGGAGQNNLEADGLAASSALRTNAVILVGERLANTKGGLTAALRLAQSTGAKLAWVPRRAGDRGAVDTGLLPGLLPGGRPVDDASARVDVAAAWGVQDLPQIAGRDLEGIVEAAASGRLGGLLVGGVDVGDLPDPALARKALDRAEFVVSLEQRPSEVTERADVVLPVAAVAEKAGTYVDWEGRERAFVKALEESDAQPDLWALAGIAREAGAGLGFSTVEAARREYAELGAWDGERAAAPAVDVAEPVPPVRGQAVLASWKPLLDRDPGRNSLLVGEKHLAETAKTPYVRVSKQTAVDLGVSDGDELAVTGRRGTVRLPLAIADLPDGVVWTPEGPDAAGSIVQVGPAPREPVSSGGDV